MSERDFVVHDTAGVCRIDGETQLDGVPGTYYVLTPLYMNQATFYTPKDSPRVRLRPVMTAQEAAKLMAQIPQVLPLSYGSLNEQRNGFAAILKSGDSYQLARLTKTLYQDQRRRSRQNRRAGLGDVTMLKKAESLLFGELATALERPFEDIQNSVRSDMEQ